MPPSLRTRIFIACFAIGTGIAVFFGVLSVSLLEMLEFEQVDLVLKDELAAFMSDHARDPDAARPRTSFIQTWVTVSGREAQLPPALRSLGTGAREVSINGRELRVIAAEGGGFSYVLAMDLTLMEAWEARVTWLLIALVAISIAISALLGRWLSNRVVSPLVELATHISREPEVEGATGDRTPLPGELAEDELGQLARALSRYMALLRAHARREREFSAQASHELRTPVAIAASSLELAMASSELSPRTRAQLARASRAMDWMKETIETLLAMARAQSGASTGTISDAASIIRDQLPAAQTLLDGRPVRLELAAAAGVRVAALPGAFRAVVRNLLVNACTHTERGSVHIALAPGSLTISDSGHGLQDDELEAVFEPFYRGANASVRGEGLGLAIVKRICEHYGWAVSLERNADGGLTTRVRFGGSTPAQADDQGHGDGDVRPGR